MKSEKETGKFWRLVNGRRLCFVSSEQTGQCVRLTGQQRRMNQTPEDLRKRRRRGGEKERRIERWKEEENMRDLIQTNRQQR